MSIQDNAFEGVKPETKWCLLELLSSPSSTISEEDVSCPGNWIRNNFCSSLLLMAPIRSTFAPDIEDQVKLDTRCTRLFRIEQNGMPIMDSPSSYPKAGIFIVLADFGFGDAVELIAQARTGKRMDIKSLSFFPSDEFEEKVRHARMITLSRMLERSLEYIGMTAGDAFAGQDALEAIMGVVKGHESLKSALSARDIRLGMVAPENQSVSDARIKRSTM